MKTPTPQSFTLLATLLLAAGPALAQRPGDPPQPPDGGGQFQARRHHFPPRPMQPPQGPAKLGDPLPGLTPDQLALFAAGKDEFEAVEDLEGGLGPIFNNVSCVACHASAATGGAGPITVTRFGRVERGYYDPLAELGGSLLQQNAIDPAVQEIIPPQANVVVHRQSTPLFGLGLIEAIADQDILRSAQRRPIDGISGRAALVTDVVSGQTRVGRLGWKAQQATILAFAGDAYLNEMGVTSRFFPNENAPNGDTARLAQFDQIADPEDQVDPVTGRGDIDAATDFMRLLAPPSALPPTQAASAGRNTFQQLNCAVCHTPLLQTAPNPIAALDRKPVPLYSDLLLHDMGLLGDGIAQAAAGPREMKTPPLWGLRASGPYLHDGRAATVDEAIRAHDGEAAGARERYLRLRPPQRDQLLEFLNSL